MAEGSQPSSKPSEEQPEESTLILPTDAGTYGDSLGTNMASKTTWAELVGLTAEEAEKKIKEERPVVQVQVVPANSFVTTDFRQNRVRLYVDSSGKIDRAPRIG